MGTINHDAIIVTGFRATSLEAVQSKAHELGLRCSSIVHSINGYQSFLIASDGHKEETADSNAGDEARAEWIAWVRDQWATDFLHFVHVRYGEVKATIVECQPDSRSEP